MAEKRQTQKGLFDAGLRISMQVRSHYRKTGTDGYRIDRVPQMPRKGQKDYLRMQFRTQGRRMVRGRVRFEEEIAARQNGFQQQVNR
jgi:hypothetical protein